MCVLFIFLFFFSFGVVAVWGWLMVVGLKRAHKLGQRFSPHLHAWQKCSYKIQKSACHRHDSAKCICLFTAYCTFWWQAPQKQTEKKKLGKRKNLVERKPKTKLNCAMGMKKWGRMWMCLYMLVSLPWSLHSMVWNFCILYVYYVILIHLPFPFPFPLPLPVQIPLTENALRNTKHCMMPSMVSPVRQKVPVRWRPLRPTVAAASEAWTSALCWPPPAAMAVAPPPTLTMPLPAAADAAAAAVATTPLVSIRGNGAARIRRSSESMAGIIGTLFIVYRYNRWFCFFFLFFPFLFVFIFGGVF